jgi:hypothetical protein
MFKRKPVYLEAWLSFGADQNLALLECKPAPSYPLASGG